MRKRIRQYIGILAAVVAYYIVHEGAHLITVLYYDVFRKINFMGLGMQIDVYIMGTVPMIYGSKPSQSASLPALPEGELRYISQEPSL